MAAKPGAGSSSLDRLSPVGKVGLGVLFVLLICAVYLISFYGDLANEMTAAEETAARLEGELGRARASRDVYQKDLDEKAQREKLVVEQKQKKILPDEPETLSFLSALQDAAIVSGVNLTSWTPTEQVTREFYAKVPMKLTLTGRFHQVVKFFNSVGQLDRIINIENIQIKAAKDPTTEIEVSVECLGTAFRALKVQDPAAAKRPGAGP